MPGLPAEVSVTFANSHSRRLTRNAGRDDSNVDASQSSLLCILGLLSLASEVTLGGNMTGDFLFDTSTFFSFRAFARLVGAYGDG
jgi:hypothetical protein